MICLPAPGDSAPDNGEHAYRNSAGKLIVPDRDVLCKPADSKGVYRGKIPVVGVSAKVGEKLLDGGAVVLKVVK